MSAGKSTELAIAASILLAGCSSQHQYLCCEIERRQSLQSGGRCVK